MENNILIIIKLINLILKDILMPYFLLYVRIESSNTGDRLNKMSHCDSRKYTITNQAITSDKRVSLKLGVR